MRGRTIKGTVSALETLIAITMFSAIFAIFIVKLSIANNAVVMQGISSSLELSSEAQVQRAVSIIEAPGVTLSEATMTLNGLFGNGYSLSSTPSANGAKVRGLIKRMVVIDGRIYYLVVGNDENETAN